MSYPPMDLSIGKHDLVAEAELADVCLPLTMFKEAAGLWPAVSMAGLVPINATILRSIALFELDLP